MYICDTGIFHCVWVAVRAAAADQTATHTQCRIDTVSSPDDGHIRGAADK